MKNNEFLSFISLKDTIPESSYLHDLAVIKHLMNNDRLYFSNDVTFLVGENGSGKSTLIEAIAVAYGYNAEGGSRNFNFSTRNSHSDLCEKITISRKNHPKDGFFLRAESFYNVASNIDEIQATHNYGGISLHNQSHGESFLTLVQERFWGNGLYILDEPEAALSPMKLLTLMAEIDRLVKDNSQFIIATHSPILMAFPNALIYEITEGGIKKTNYKDTEHYQITRSFLENPERMLKYLFG
ncbi:MAG: ATP-binding cassette domain-containing protein [Ruminococcaceae bacterium]|nr:ATP-binding cassette domain-containing protein [Oscillospiraceae bacterium]